MQNLGKGEASVVIGGQWGDEGKGRIVDILAKDCDIVARFQGGNNAGHSLHFDNKSLVLHLIPCGIIHEEKVAVIGNGVVIDPLVLFKEIAILKELSIEVSPKNLKISRDAQIILPLHKSLDALREKNTNQPIGTTLRGIGPCYEDKVARFGVRASDLLSKHLLLKKIENIKNNRQVDLSYHVDFVDDYLAYGQKIKPFLCDVGDYLENNLFLGKRVLFEGAQGTLLDVDHGTYPYVTSSNCVASQAATGSGIGCHWIKNVYLVSKAYCTRVGEGPFFSEANDEMDQEIRKKGQEFGATTGRPRRCGWLDLVALKYAKRVNGAKALILTKVDILQGLGPIKVVTSYKSKDQDNISFSEALYLYNLGEKVDVEYKEFDPIDDFPTNVGHVDEFPSSLKNLLSFVEESLKIPVSMVSYGPKRGQELYL